MSKNMNPKSVQTSTHLFTIRVWTEKLENGLHEWRGKIHEVSKDEGHYFRGWEALVEILQSLVTEEELEK
jgi:hypothetical protein